MPGYDLLEEPWIPVIDARGGSHEWGIRQTLHEAGRVRLAEPRAEYRIPTLRLLLALTYRILPAPGGSADGRDAWLGLYARDGFDPAQVDAYLDRWAGRFDLFDKDRPFLQTPGLATAAGPVPLREADPVESPPLFGARAASDAPVDPARAVAALLAIQAWDTAGIKPAALGSATAKRGKEYPPRGVQVMGLCGSMDMAWLEGPDLYHTLILGWSPDCARPGDLPVWERTAPPSPDPVSGRAATGPADCLAWPSRRVLLAGGPAGVTGATVTYGDATDPTTLHGLEPMGCWRRDRAHRCVPSKSPSRQGLPSMIGRALPGPSAGPGPSALSWARRALPATGIDLGWRLCTASMTYGKQASAIIDLETHSEPILPDWLTGLGGRVLDKAVAGLGAMRDAWRSYRLSMATAAGSMTHSHRARADALRADAADEAEQTLDTAMSRILSGRLDPVHAAAEAASEISAWPSPDQPSPFAPHNGVIPALRRRALLEDLSAAVLGPDMSYLTDVARAIAQETESLDHLARTALEQGWPSTALAHAYGKSASSVKRLRDHARATTVSAPGPDPRPDMMDARIRIQTLSQLLMDLCAQAEAQGKSMASIEQATGVSRMTLYRRRGHTDDGLWQVWMPEDTWADRHTPKATAHAVLAAMPETGPAQDRMERTLSSWSRDPRILTDRASGLRILPSATWDIRPDPPQDTDSQPAEHKKTQARPRKRRARVTTQEAQRIQSLYNAKQASVKELSTQYGVSVSTIYNIIRRGRE